MSETRTHHGRTLGFTLIELSIVLVIIGLIAGGIVAGRELIRQAEIRATVKEIENYKSAINTFRGKYNCVPGDCSKAPSLGLGSAGNNDGRVNCGGCGLTDVGAVANQEVFYLWQHLATAQLIPGTYTGLTGPATTFNAVPGVNVPRSKLGSSIGYTLGDFATIPAVYFAIFQQSYGQALLIAGSANGGINFDASIRAEDAYRLDQKIDDGKPGQGLMQSYTAAHMPNCASSSDPVTAIYLLNSTSLSCALIYDRMF